MDVLKIRSRFCVGALCVAIRSAAAAVERSEELSTSSPEERYR